VSRFAQSADKPRVLLLLPTSTYRTAAFMQAAARLGVYVTVGSEEPSTMTELNPTGLVTLDFANSERAAEQAAEFAAKNPIAAVVPVDDQATAVGAAICQRLGLPANSIASALAARNKHRMRELLARAGVPQPAFRLGSFADDLAQLARGVSFPCVVKPLALAASKGVIRANDPGEFVTAVARLAKILKNEYSALSSQNLDSERFLVEDFIAGPEVAVEGLLTRGQLRVLAIFDKPDPLDGPYFEETIYVTPSRRPAAIQQQIADVTADACRALGLVHGPVHAELRLKSGGRSQGAGVRGQGSSSSAISDQQSAINDSSTTHHSPLTTHLPVVIEVNPRSIGGLCSRVLRFGVGLSLEELIIRHALDPDFIPPDREGKAAGVMMVPIPRAGILRDVRGLDSAGAVAGIESVTISAHSGQRLVPLPEGSIYLGFIFARGRSPDAVEAALREAHARLEFVIDS